MSGLEFLFGTLEIGIIISFLTFTHQTLHFQIGIIDVHFKFSLKKNNQKKPQLTFESC